jgi:hypothetical protein
MDAKTRILDAEELSALLGEGPSDNSWLVMHAEHVPGEFYQYRVRGLNLCVPPTSPARRFSWSIPAFEPRRYANGIGTEEIRSTFERVRDDIYPNTLDAAVTHMVCDYSFDRADVKRALVGYTFEDGSP